VTHPSHSHDKVAKLAEMLWQAEVACTPVAPITDTHLDVTLSDAYAIQQYNIERRISTGDRIVGHKIGLTAKAMQVLFGVDEPDYGHLLQSMIHPENEPLDLSKFIDPQIEVEPAFVLKKDLKGPDVDIEAVLDATEYVTVCFEIIDSRITDWRIKLQDTVADNGSSALVVLGKARVPARDIKLDTLETTLEIDGETVETGTTEAILGHPANGVAWLANKISEFGVGLSAGDIVLPGTCTKSRRMAGAREAVGRIAGLDEVRLAMKGEPTVHNQR